VSHGTQSESARQVDTREACRILGVSRSTLNRWERSGRIRRVATVAGRPYWDVADPALPETTDTPDADPGLDRRIAELRRLVEAGGDALSGSRPLRHMEQVIRHRLALRTVRGDRVAVGEIAELMRLDSQAPGRGVTRRWFMRL
jgi:excisionase family DNA binding protein